jgi:hypothetical protein
MTTIELYPDDVHNQRTIRQGHPPDWVSAKVVTTTWWCSAADRAASPPPRLLPQAGTASL